MDLSLRRWRLNQTKKRKVALVANFYWLPHTKPLKNTDSRTSEHVISVLLCVPLPSTSEWIRILSKSWFSSVDHRPIQDMNYKRHVLDVKLLLSRRHLQRLRTRRAGQFGQLLSGPRSCFQIKANFAFPLDSGRKSGDAQILPPTTHAHTHTQAVSHVQTSEFNHWNESTWW